jgi:hypothetical protein
VLGEAKLVWRQNLMLDLIIRMINGFACIEMRFSDGSMRFRLTSDPIPVQGKTRSPVPIHGENMGWRAMPEKRDASTRTESSILITMKIHQGDAGTHDHRWQGGDEQN